MYGALVVCLSTSLQEVQQKGCCQEWNVADLALFFALSNGLTRYTDRMVGRSLNVESKKPKKFCQQERLKCEPSLTAKQGQRRGD